MMKNGMTEKRIRLKLRQARLKRVVMSPDGVPHIMKQAEAAREISAKYDVNLGPCYFGMIERGEKTGSVKVMKAIAHYFGLDIRDIL